MQMDQAISLHIQDKAVTVTDPAGRGVAVLSDGDAMEIARRFGMELPEIYREALRISIYPYRYIRNRDAVSPAEQFRLAESRVAVVGAGGLGGQVILLLARAGIGRLTVVDHDAFDETNLNRQALCNAAVLQAPKAEVAARIVAEINPGVAVTACRERLTATFGARLLSGADVIVDGLDSVRDRLVLQDIAHRLHVPLVHGALAGFEGRIMTVYPGDPGLALLYGGDGTAAEEPPRPEALLGVPAVTAAAIGSLQAMEVLKILLGRGEPFRNAMLHVDLENGRWETFRFDAPAGGKS